MIAVVLLCIVVFLVYVLYTRQMERVCPMEIDVLCDECPPEEECPVLKCLTCVKPKCKIDIPNKDLGKLYDLFMDIAITLKKNACGEKKYGFLTRLKQTLVGKQIPCRKGFDDNINGPSWNYTSYLERCMDSIQSNKPHKAYNELTDSWDDLTTADQCKQYANRQFPMLKSYTEKDINDSGLIGFTLDKELQLKSIAISLAKSFDSKYCKEGMIDGSRLFQAVEKIADLVCSDQFDPDKIGATAQYMMSLITI